MKPEPLPMSEAARDLFAAARRESPSRAHRERVLAKTIESSRVSSQSRVRALFVATPVLLAAAALLLVVTDWQEPAPNAITAEPTVAVPVSASTRVPAAPASASVAPSAVMHPEVVEVAPQLVRAPPKPQRRVPSLSEEVEALDLVRTTLDGGDPETTLALLDAYDRRGGHRLRAEATLLRIEALARSGRSGEASKLAEQFVAKNPGSPLIDRARAFLVPQTAPNPSGSAFQGRPQGFD